jgi:Flp pilus assembly protein TadD
MLEPLQQKSWSRLDRRAWGLSLSILLLISIFACIAFFYGQSWTYRTEIEYIPKELTINAYEIGSDLMEFGLRLPNYAFGEYFVVTQILPESWLYPFVLVVFVLAISFCSAGLSYFSGTWLYGVLFGLAAGTALFGLEVFEPLGIKEKWISALAFLAISLPVYVINNWFSNWNLARRWWVILLFYSSLTFLFVWKSGSSGDLSLITAQLWPALLLASLSFIVLNSTDVLQSVLTLVTKEENSKQSWIHFTVFGLLYLSNFILIYLRNTRMLVLDIFYLNPFFLQACTLVAGFWMLEKKNELVGDNNLRNVGLSVVYVSLGIITTLTAGLSFGLANDLMIEVLEDAICLIHFCMGVSFFLYVLINYFQLMGMGLRVHQVMFRPKYMPVFAIPVFGLGGVLVFLLNETYFPVYQALAAKEVLLADHAQYVGDSFMAENYLKNAISIESRNQRSNLSLAGLYYKQGNAAKAHQYAEISLDKLACPEAYIAMAQIYRQKQMSIYELLQLQDGLRKFPEEGRLLNNIGITFSETVFKDSAQYYLSKASETGKSAATGKANLGYFYLINKKDADGLPEKSPEQTSSGDWAQLNNNLVFANVAHEKSPSISNLISDFETIPESIQPFILYHTLLNKAITKDSADFGKLVSLENDTIKKYHADAITLAKGMLLYRNGSMKTGLENLLALYQTTKGARLDLNVLLGQIYFEQGAFQTSTEYFKKASEMGLKKARYWYGLSCLDAGLKNEAADAFNESLNFINQSDQIRITVLIDGLKSGKFQNAAQRSDPEKSAYIKMAWNQLTDQQVVDLIYLISEKEAQRYLWFYAFKRAYRENLKSRCKSLLKFGNDIFSKSEKWRKQLIDCKPLVLEISNDKKGLETWLLANGDENQFPYLYARLAQMNNQNEKAMAYYLKAIEANPLNTRQMGMAISFISKMDGKRSIAYQKSLELTDLDPGNPEFLKLYALLAVQEGLPEFALQVLPKIEYLSSKTSAESFRKQLEKEIAEKNYPTVQSY